MDIMTKSVTHSLNLAATLTNRIPCMRYTPLALLTTLALLHSHNLFCITNSCTSSSSLHLQMCFGKTKTLKTLRNKCNTNSEIELGFNIDDRCDYIDPKQLVDTDFNRTSLNIIQLTCRGLKSKLDQIEDLLVQTKYPDVLILSETWLKNGEEKLVKIKGYKFEGTAREHKKGGGVGILIRDNVIYKNRPDLNANNQNNSYENCFIELKGSKYNIIIGSIYRPPNTDIDQFLDAYNNNLENISHEKNKELVLGLDHNLDLLKQTIHKKTQNFVEDSLDHSLLPVITKPTRISKSSATLIDNIIISDKLKRDYTSSILINNLSDHLPCYLEINDFLAGKKEAAKIKKHRLNKNNLDKIKNEIKTVKWEKLLSGKNATESFDIVHKKIITSIDKFAPEIEVRIRNKQKNKPWISKGIANSIRKSKQLFKKSLKDATLQDKYHEYIKCLNKIKRASYLNT